MRAIPYRLERIQIIKSDIESAWEFFSNPSNLSLITPPDMDFRIISPVEDKAYSGQIITYSVKPLFGIKVNWTTEITHLQKPFFFVDEQRFGPYRFWHHQHRFIECPGGVEMTDTVHYLLHQELFSALINRLIVSPRLKMIFDYRENQLKEIFGGTVK